VDAPLVQVALHATQARLARPLTYAVPPDCPVVPGQLVWVPLSTRAVTGVVVGPGAAAVAPVRPLLAALSPAPLLAAWQLALAEWIAARYACGLGAALAGFLPPAARAPLRLALVPERAAGPEAADLRAAFGRRRYLPLAEAARRLGVERVARALRAGVLATVLDAPPRAARCAPLAHGLPSRSTLTTAQAAAVDLVEAAMAARRGEGFLLHGVTGSGKTHVYLHAVHRALARDRQALVLVSDISLVPAALQHYEAWFPGLVAVVHSARSPAEQRGAWRRIASGEARVVLGARSALFAPLVDLGVIIVDEEHEPAYKQQDLAPCYHTREVALQLGRLVGAPVVLGSATPDVGTYHRACKGELHLLTLPRRYQPRAGADSGQLPSVEVVDLRAELAAGHTSIFSRALLQALSRTLDTGAQAILYLNRRGTATCVVCRDCGHTVRCPDCELPMVYHGDLGLLLCHHCNRRRPPPPRCPACAGARIRYFGTGTQRVEEEVRRHFPGARLLRWDRDTVDDRGAHERLWAAFNAGEADILVGTQMIAKGFDFPRVALVGVVLADAGLFLPDFRAAERTFQLLTQVAGRAGRGPQPGQVIVQTYTPGHYAIQAARHHDYVAFAARELAFRAEHGYPPYQRLARLLYADPDEARCWREAGRILRALRALAARRPALDARVIGPAPAFLRRLRGRHRWQLLIAAAAPERLLADYALPRGWTVDVDPVSML
jgi:primosomal protein N' (replication factor Y)